MELCFFLGCNTPAIRPDVERAIRATMPELGVDLVDAEGYVCCPAFGSFPSTDDDSHLASSGWNLSIAESKGLDMVVECGSCYSSLRMGQHLLASDETKRARVNELLKPSGRQVKCKNKIRHISDVLYNEVGCEKISGTIKKDLKGLCGVIQYPCHTLFPSEIVCFEDSPRQPKILAELTRALGAEVNHYSRELQCCGGAGGFTNNSPAEAAQFTREKFDAIINETKADFIVVSCIPCLMHLDNMQKQLNEADQSNTYNIPVFDYNQLLALCMGVNPEQVASIFTIPRQPVLNRFK
ncbi:MAG: CoB--CoM heterodisulfide reductase iron-sulfur subunit B family protein [Thermodesulfobacteriota bacterium]|nr:CoB--CoM heterodisulfide reductase iron-sulfur subunit B family protein [Thermodesulfobacteriota bacterium]